MGWPAGNDRLDERIAFDFDLSQLARARRPQLGDAMEALDHLADADREAGKADRPIVADRLARRLVEFQESLDHAAISRDGHYRVETDGNGAGDAGQRLAEQAAGEAGGRLVGLAWPDDDRRQAGAASVEETLAR